MLFVDTPFKKNVGYGRQRNADAWDSLHSGEYIGVRHLWTSVRCNQLGRASWRIENLSYENKGNLSTCTGGMMDDIVERYRCTSASAMVMTPQLTEPQTCGHESRTN